jgi:hypothetical protein
VGRINGIRLKEFRYKDEGVIVILQGLVIMMKKWRDNVV